MRFTILLLLLPILSQAQSTLYLKAAVGNYAMTGMRKFQQELVDAYENDGIPAKAVLAYPVSLQGEFGIDLHSDKISKGVFFNYAITEGRIYYGDYSGETFVHQNVSRIFFGYKVGRKLTKSLDVSWKLGPNFSYLEMISSTQLTDMEALTETLNFRSIGGSLTTSFNYTIPVKRFRFIFGGGLELNYNGKTNYPEQKGAYLSNEGGNPVLLNWTGFRLDAGIGYSLD